MMGIFSGGKPLNPRLHLLWLSSHIKDKISYFAVLKQQVWIFLLWYTKFEKDWTHTTRHLRNTAIC